MNRLKLLTLTLEWEDALNEKWELLSRGLLALPRKNVDDERRVEKTDEFLRCDPISADFQHMLDSLMTNEEKENGGGGKGGGHFDSRDKDLLRSLEDYLLEHKMGCHRNESSTTARIAFNVFGNNKALHHETSCFVKTVKYRESFLSSTSEGRDPAFSWEHLTSSEEDPKCPLDPRYHKRICRHECETFLIPLFGNYALTFKGRQDKRIHFAPRVPGEEDAREKLGLPDVILNRNSFWDDLNVRLLPRSGEKRVGDGFGFPIPTLESLCNALRKIRERDEENKAEFSIHRLYVKTHLRDLTGMGRWKTLSEEESNRLFRMLALKNALSPTELYWDAYGEKNDSPAWIRIPKDGTLASCMLARSDTLGVVCSKIYAARPDFFLVEGKTKEMSELSENYKPPVVIEVHPGRAMTKKPMYDPITNELKGTESSAFQLMQTIDGSSLDHVNSNNFYGLWLDWFNKNKSVVPPPPANETDGEPSCDVEKAVVEDSLRLRRPWGKVGFIYYENPLLVGTVKASFLIATRYGETNSKRFFDLLKSVCENCVALFRPAVREAFGKQSDLNFWGAYQHKSVNQCCLLLELYHHDVVFPEIKRTLSERTVDKRGGVENPSSKKEDLRSEEGGFDFSFAPTCLIRGAISDYGKKWESSSSATDWIKLYFYCHLCYDDVSNVFPVKTWVEFVEQNKLDAQSSRLRFTQFYDGDLTRKDDWGDDRLDLGLTPPGACWCRTCVKEYRSVVNANGGWYSLGRKIGPNGKRHPETYSQHVRGLKMFQLVGIEEGSDGGSLEPTEHRKARNFFANFTNTRSDARPLRCCRPVFTPKSNGWMRSASDRFGVRRFRNRTRRTWKWRGERTKTGYGRGSRKQEGGRSFSRPIFESLMAATKSFSREKLDENSFSAGSMLLNALSTRHHVAMADLAIQSELGRGDEPRKTSSELGIEIRGDLERVGLEGNVRETSEIASRT